MERKKGRTQQQAAAKANLRSRDTVAKYERLERLPSELRQPRTYRTRSDPFVEDWATVETMLTDAPELEAKALFEWLCTEHPGRYTEGQLRTFQRHVTAWRALSVPKMVTLEQDRVPGEVMQTDGTWMNELRVTIAGETFDHILIHSVLPYSNWEWGTVAQSESLLAIKMGFQTAVRQLGHVATFHQTDNTTAATHNLKVVTDETVWADSGRVYNADYVALLAHYGVRPRTTHLDAPDENGDIEAANGALKRALEQALLLRGHRDFASVEAYVGFLEQAMARRNALRQKRLAEELSVMQAVTVRPLPDGREYRVSVSRDGTIRVLGNGYSVPSGLMGKQVTAWVYEWDIVVYYGTHPVQRMPRQTGTKQVRINYRHVIDTLLRKPGGFRRYRYREQLFPTPTFREAWEALDARLSPRRADLTYLRILKLAAGHLEADVDLALKLVMADAERWDDETIAALVCPTLTPAPYVERGEVDLVVYDGLLDQEDHRDVA